MLRRLFLLSSICCLTAALAQGPPPPVHTHLKVGDMAPDFTLRSTSNQMVKISDFRGKSNVVLAFYPAAFTGGCTKEMTAYGADVAKFEAQGAKVFGVSTDNVFSQQYWATEVLKVDVEMLSDFNKEVSKQYGILMPQGMASRTTFIVDTAGKIQFIEEGNDAIDIATELTACSRLKK
jgi:peroxiredoxin